MYTVEECRIGRNGWRPGKSMVAGTGWFLPQSSQREQRSSPLNSSLLMRVNVDPPKILVRGMIQSIPQVSYPQC